MARIRGLCCSQSVGIFIDSAHTPKKYDEWKSKAVRKFRTEDAVSAPEDQNHVSMETCLARKSSLELSWTPSSSEPPMCELWTPAVGETVSIPTGIYDVENAAENLKTAVIAWCQALTVMKGLTETYKEMIEVRKKKLTIVEPRLREIFKNRDNAAETRQVMMKDKRVAEFHISWDPMKEKCTYKHLSIRPMQAMLKDLKQPRVASEAKQLQSTYYDPDAYALSLLTSVRDFYVANSRVETKEKFQCRRKILEDNEK